MIFALVGNQNCGKTTLFNALTGSNQHVGNFPGVTVDQKMGEMRDDETMEVAMQAAETGQLLFSTLHTTGAANTMDRIIDAFPAARQGQVRVQLAMILQGVISQQLVPTTDGGQTVAFEIMDSTPAIRTLIREDRTHQIDASIQAGAALGMCTMDDSLAALCRAGKITKETASLLQLSLSNLNYCIMQTLSYPLYIR